MVNAKFKRSKYKNYDIYDNYTADFSESGESGRFGRIFDRNGHLFTPRQAISQGSTESRPTD